MAEIVILGAGVMGAAMSLPAAYGGHRVGLVGTPLDDEIIRSVAVNGRHPGLGVTLPANVSAHHAPEFGVLMAARPDLLILGVSSAGVNWAIEQIVESVKTPLPVLMITKGLVPKDGSIEVLPHKVAREIEARTGMRLPIMAVGGPCIAGELAALRDTCVVVTGADAALVDTTLGLLEAPFYHARASQDVVGVELCAAFKNFYALAVGASLGRLEKEGRGSNGALMYNLSSSTFTQALEEMTILVESLGGKAQTVRGLPGAGDLYVTCQAGRNSKMGRFLGLGLSYSAAKTEHMAKETVEGAQLALDLGPTLEGLLASGALPAEHLPLTAAIVAAICRDAPLDLAFDRFHRIAN
jgi:glycerol-3-phosphate dehydrogenase (NAD(P)+)